MKILKILKFWPILIQTMVYANIVAVLEIVPADDEVELTLSQYRHLTDELRNRARMALPEEFSILTRDNMISLLPQDEEEAACIADGCAVTIGRAIGADYVTQGQIRIFDGKLTLTVELFSSMNGNLLGSFVTESESATGLLGTIREKAAPMFEKIPKTSESRLTRLMDLQDEEKPKVDTVVVSHPASASKTFKIGTTAKIGLVNNGFVYSAGLVAVMDFGFVDFVPELLFTGEEFEIDEKSVRILRIEMPLMVRVVLANALGISLGAVAALPLSAEIEGVAPKDAESFGVGAIGGLSYLLAENVLLSAYYGWYFTEDFKSVKNSNRGKVLCAVSYLF